MSEIRFRDDRDYFLAPSNSGSQDGRWAVALGVVAMLLGLAAAAAGAFIGFGTSARLVALPAGLPAAEPEMVAIFMFVCGGITMLLGVVSIYKANGN